MFINSHSLHLGKHSKSSQRIESDSDSAHANDNFHSQDPVDDLGDIQPIGEYGFV